MSPRSIDETTLAAREAEILDAALGLMAEHGISGLTIDKIVSRVSYSKGTVYNHFSSKEDVFTGLCNRNMALVLDLFRRAISIEGSSREKMTAIGYTYFLTVLINPQQFNLKMNATMEIFDKASTARKEQHSALDQSIMGLCNQPAEMAVENGDLVLQEGVTTMDVSLSLYSTIFGTIALMLKQGACGTGTAGGVLDMKRRVMAHGNLVMDGLGWRRTTNSRSDDELIAHLNEHIFAKEIAMLEGL